MNIAVWFNISALTQEMFPYITGVASLCEVNVQNEISYDS